MQMRSRSQRPLQLTGLALGYVLLTVSGSAAQEAVEPVPGESTPSTLQETASSPVVRTTPAAGRRRTVEATCPPPDGTRPDPALVNTDSFVLARFGLKRVYDQLLQRASVSGQTSKALYQQMWDTMDTADQAKFRAPHCDDTDPAAINGFPIECPRPEVTLKDSHPDLFVPVALTNRFDLAPADGANCGEFRIVYAMKPFDPENRNLMIFEGVLPNPNPGCGLDACRPVVDFWRELASVDVSTKNGRNQLAERLDRFYFKGINGFSPVIHPNHYGMSGRGGYGGVNGGQIRTNMFVTGTLWQMREFHLLRRCRAGRCRLVLEPVAVGSNPFPALFDENDPAPDARAASFIASFPAQTANLITDDVNLISLGTAATYNAGQSTTSDPADDYLRQAIAGLSAQGQSQLTTGIRAELTRLGREHVSTLDVVERALTQSCGGCHQFARNAGLSDDGASGPVWPDTRPGGFVHIDENSFLSPALWCTFLPFRKAVLDSFANSEPIACPSAGAHRSAQRRVVTRSQELPSSSSVPLTVSGKLFGAN